MNVTLKQLRAFYEVARTNSFTRAAQEMNLTQSAVSMLIRQLESEYGMILFDRVQRSARLTEVGKQMLPVTERILEDLQQVYEGAADLKALKRGRLRLAVPQMLACARIPPLVARFTQTFPEVALHIIDTTGDRVVTAVTSNDAEIGIGPERPVPEGISCTPLWKEPIQVVLPRSSSLANADHLSWGELSNENWIQYSDDFTLYLERTIWNRLPIPKSRMTSVRYLTTALACVGNGMGITAAPRYARIFEDQFQVTFRDIADTHIEREFFLYERSNHHRSPAADAFVTLLKPAPSGAAPAREQTGPGSA